MQFEESKSLKILKNKLKEWFDANREGKLPTYAVHSLLCILKKEEELKEDATFSKSIREYLIKQNPLALKDDSIYAAIDHSIFDWNWTYALYKCENDTKNLSEFKFVEKCIDTCQILEPWQVLLDLGPASSHFEYKLIVEVLKDFGKTNIRGLAHTLIILSNKFAEEDNRNNQEVIVMKWILKGDMTYMKQDLNEYPKCIYTWSKDNIVKALKEVYSTTAWIDLIKFLDVDLDAREELYFQSQEAFSIFVDLWMQLRPQNKLFPIEFLIANTWKNKKAQIICIDYSINHSYINNDIPFDKAKRRLDLVIQLQEVKPAFIPYLKIWKWIDLVQTLITLSESSYYTRIKSLFEPPINWIPEYLLLCLLKSKLKTGQLLVDELWDKILPIFLVGHINSVPVLTEMWEINKEKVINSIVNIYKKNPQNLPLSRVLDISRAMKNSLLDMVIYSKDIDFAIHLGLIGSKRDFLQFDTIIKIMIQTHGNLFVKRFLNYIDRNIIFQYDESNKNSIERLLDTSMLNEDKLTIVYENFTQLVGKDPSILEEDTKTLISESFTKISHIFPSVNPDQKNNDEIENKANEYFQQLYKEEKNVDDIVKIMREFRSSQNATEREIHACMVQNLFDEWKFLPTYPKKALHMTAKLFGKILSEKKIIDGVVSDIGLKWIIEGLKREGKIFDFTITALEECKDSIEYEADLVDILSWKQLKERKLELYENINKRYLSLKGMNKEITLVDQNQVNQSILNEAAPAPITHDLKEEKNIVTRIIERNSPDTEEIILENSIRPQNIIRENKIIQPNLPNVGTPTQTRKIYYFANQNQDQRFHNTPKQIISTKDFYNQPIPPQSKSTKPFDATGYQSPPLEGSTSSLSSRALNRQSKDFKPKSLKIQEYLKNESLILPPDFNEMLITVLNMTGTDQIQRNAHKLESFIKEEYIQPMVNSIIISRVIESDEK